MVQVVVTATNLHYVELCLKKHFIHNFLYTVKICSKSGEVIEWKQTKHRSPDWVESEALR